MDKFLKKLKLKELLNNDKKIVLVIIVGFISIFLIAISEVDFNDSKDDMKSINEQMDSYEYCNYLETRVADIVSSIEGAGEVRVLITLAETTEYVYAQNQNGTKKESKDSENFDNKNDYVIIEKNNDDSGLLIKTFEPKIRGVAIVCTGGDIASVQQQIYSTISAVLNISTSRISISKLTTEKE